LGRAGIRPGHYRTGAPEVIDNLSPAEAVPVPATVAS
jgi:hypothetical protein